MPPIPPYIARNLFPASHAAIVPLSHFKFDRTHRPTSSQALAIDVFGSFKCAPSRDGIFDAVAKDVGLPPGGPWGVQLEWTSHGNPLHEDALTHVDVAAQGRHTLLLFECKFTERSPGSCSQPKLVRSGTHRGVIQCNGRYLDQANPITGAQSRCALSGKGIRYWDVIPKVFHGMDAFEDHDPCPFARGWFQLMRNVVLLHELAPPHGAVIMVYAEGARLATPRHLARGYLQGFHARMVSPSLLRARSYQRLVELARAVDPQSHVWPDLESWIAKKTAAVL